MKNKFWIIPTILIFLLLALVLTLGFKTINGMSSGASQYPFGIPPEMIFYGLKIINLIIELVAEIMWQIKVAWMTIKDIIELLAH